MAQTLTSSAVVGTRSTRAGGARLVGVAALVVSTTLLSWFVWSNRTSIDPSAWLGSARWGWVGLALAGALGAVAGAALNLMGAASVRLSFLPTAAAQVTGTVARLVSPASVGGSAVNVQYLRRAGEPTSRALGTVSVAQAVQVVSTMALLPIVCVALGTGMRGLALPPAATVFVGLAAVAAAGIGIGVLLRVSSDARARMRRFLAELADAMAALVAVPGRAAVCVGGALTITLALTTTLWAAGHAFGAQLGFGHALLILLFGSTAGGLVPVPGGVGAIDAALVAALGATGVGLAIAVPAVALFRLATLWLQLPAGLVAGAVLRRKGVL